MKVCIVVKQNKKGVSMICQEHNCVCPDLEAEQFIKVSLEFTRTDDRLRHRGKQKEKERKCSGEKRKR